MDQLQLESMFSRRAAKEHVHDLLLEDQVTMQAIERGIQLLYVWSLSPSKYKSKQDRKNTLRSLDLQNIVEEIFTRILLLKSPATLASMTGQIRGIMGFDDSRQGITLAAEILAVLCATDLFDIAPLARNGTFYIIPNIALDTEDYDIVSRCMYLPPLIEKPKKLRHNFSSGYHSLVGDSLILGGKQMHHDEEICLDVLNTMNQVPLSLNVEFLEQVEEVPSFDSNDVLNDPTLSQITKADIIRQQKNNWEDHLRRSQHLYQLLIEEGNKFYMTHKVDKRGRIYTQGHHVNPQGASFKKAMVDLYHKETVDIPEGFFS